MASKNFAVIKNFDGKEIEIRGLLEKDLKKAKKFQDFINSLVEENAKILINTKKTLKQEQEWLKSVLEGVKKRKKVFLFAKHNNKVVGTTGIELGEERKKHVGDFGIAIIKGYRGIGLGKYMIQEILRQAKELKPIPKCIRLGVYPNNKPALALYKKSGFKKVAVIPKQITFGKKMIDEIIMVRKP